MASFVLTDARIEVNSGVLSTKGNKVTVNYEAADQENSAFGSTAESHIAGLTNWSFEIDFLQDYASGSVDATLFPLVGAAAFPVKIRPTTAAISATNPEYQGNAILTSYQPLGQGVGEVAQASATLRGTGALTRATA